jgi:DNA gyrase/topoisomerase IV subunit A
MIRPLAQTFLALQGEIPKMSKLPDLFENQKDYESAFRESYLKVDVRKIVIAYKVHLVLQSPMDRLTDRSGVNIKFALTRARNLVWALLIQGVLNDTSLVNNLVLYGTSLRKEAPFREYLKDLASSKLLPVLRVVLRDTVYRQKIAQENYEFLRSKEVFRRCIEEAYERFQWTKKGF